MEATVYLEDNEYIALCIVFEVQLRRNFEPLHIDSPVCNALFIDEIDG